MVHGKQMGVWGVETEVRGHGSVIPALVVITVADFSFLAKRCPNANLKTCAHSISSHVVLEHAAMLVWALKPKPFYRGPFIHVLPAATFAVVNRRYDVLRLRGEESMTHVYHPAVVVNRQFVIMLLQCCAFRDAAGGSSC